MANILCVDDDASVCAALEGTLRRAGHSPIIAPGVPDALREVARGNVDLIISDYQMPGLTGIEFLTLLGSEGYDVPVIMLTGYASIDHAVAAVKAGATEYLQKPFEREHLELAVAQALAHARLRRENALLREEVSEYRRARDSTGESGAVGREPGPAEERAPGPVASADPVATADAAREGTETIVLTSLNVDDAERALIDRALERTGGNRTRAAKLLGISVRTLRNKLNRGSSEPADDTSKEGAAD
jgi:DNA-binding NtrC family response regulator